MKSSLVRLLELKSLTAGFRTFCTPSRLTSEVNSWLLVHTELCFTKDQIQLARRQLGCPANKGSTADVTKARAAIAAAEAKGVEAMPQSLIAEIIAEQRHGRSKYGRGPDDLAHDDGHLERVWHECIDDHNRRAFHGTPMERRQSLVKVAGLAISAIQAFDRKRAAQPLNAARMGGEE